MLSFRFSAPPRMTAISELLISEKLYRHHIIIDTINFKVIKNRCERGVKPFLQRARRFVQIEEKNLTQFLRPGHEVKLLALSGEVSKPLDSGFRRNDQKSLNIGQIKWAFAFDKNFEEDGFLFFDDTYHPTADQIIF